MKMSKIFYALLLGTTLQTQHSKPVTIPAGINFATGISMVGAGTTLKMAWHNRDDKSIIGIGTFIIITDIFSAYLSQGNFNKSQKVILPIMLNCVSAAISGFLAQACFHDSQTTPVNITCLARAGCSAAQTALCAHRIYKLLHP